MKRLAMTATLALTVLVTAAAAGRAQFYGDCAAPNIALYAPVATPVQPYLGNNYSFYPPSYSYYPGYQTYYAPPMPVVTPSYYQPRYLNPGPYYYTPAYSYTPGYYSFYYTPGYFRY